MAERTAIFFSIFALLALVASPSRADIVARPRPSPAVVACEGRDSGQGCSLRGTAGMCLRQVTRSSSAGGLWSGEQRVVLCVPNREISPEMRACATRAEWTACSVRGVPGRCELVDRFLRCRPAPGAGPTT